MKVERHIPDYSVTMLNTNRDNTKRRKYCVFPVAFTWKKFIKLHATHYKKKGNFHIQIDIKTNELSLQPNEFKFWFKI